MGSKQKYIHNYAKTLANQLKVDTFLLQGDLVRVAPGIVPLASAIRDRYRQNILPHMYRQRDEVLGKIIGSSQLTTTSVSIKDVDRGDLTPLMGGHSMLVQLATLAVIAAMADNIWADIQRDQAARNFKEPKSPYGFWATRHGGM